MIDNLLIELHILVKHLTTPSVDKMLLPKYVNRSTKFRGKVLTVVLAPSCPKEYQVQSVK